MKKNDSNNQKDTNTIGVQKRGAAVPIAAVAPKAPVSQNKPKTDKKK